MGHLYVVGQLYVATRTHWEERTDYNFRQGEHELRLFINAPTEIEIEAIESAEVELGLYVEGSAIFLLYRFGSILSGEGSYSWWLVQPDQRTIPTEPGEQERALLHIVLVDAKTGILRAMRAITFSPRFTANLHAAIRKQAKSGFDPREHEKDIARAYRRYPDTGDMFGAAADRCIGGE
jgi:hypothetical protein